MRDFSLQAYKELLISMQINGYTCIAFGNSLDAVSNKAAILRHDVDKMPQNALDFAKLEHQKGIQASYYFRILTQSFHPGIIKEIASLGHEIGYHYEDMDICKGDVDKAYSSFRKNLAKLREIVPVTTICMHGSPLSRYDNRDLWSKYDYRDDGIIGEPYFDLDYSKVFYLTDTGRKWNASESCIRDKVQSPYSIQVKDTFHLIQLIKAGKLPNHLMINTHPQRWNDSILPWTKELVWQNAKNIVKKSLLKIRTKEEE